MPLHRFMCFLAVVSRAVEVHLVLGNPLAHPAILQGLQDEIQDHITYHTKLLQDHLVQINFPRPS